MEVLAHNLSVIRKRIEKTCLRIGRDPKTVRLLLATKTVDANRINKALELGETLIGENKVQELKLKGLSVQAFKPEIHFIGHLQSNKIKEVLKWATCIESIDRLSIAQKLQQRLEFEDKHVEVYIQVNTSSETSKFGVLPEEVIDLVKDITLLDRIHIKGLMTIGLLSSELEDVRRCFKILKQMQESVIQLNLSNVEMNELSMGMSSDLEIAIEEGATIVRIGTAIFGERCYPDQYYWDETK